MKTQTRLLPAPHHREERIAGGMTIVLCLLVFAIQAAAGETRFLTVLRDVPLMPGFEEVADCCFDFETESGRIAGAEAIGAATQHEAVYFYLETLPQLGWKRMAAPSGRDLPAPAERISFGREGETLNIDFFTEAERLRVRFTLSPDTARQQGGE